MSPSVSVRSLAKESAAISNPPLQPPVHSFRYRNPKKWRWKKKRGGGTTAAVTADTAGPRPAATCALRCVADMHRGREGCEVGRNRKKRNQLKNTYVNKLIASFSVSLWLPAVLFQASCSRRRALATTCSRLIAPNGLTRCVGKGG